MKVILAGGQQIELGTVEARPTIGIIDYSRRVTDEFGVTTVVERGFAQRMSVRLALPFAQVDALQQQLAKLRATPAQWVVEDGGDWLSIEGFYKEFSVDLNVPPLSYCTLTVEGLAGTAIPADPGGDPAVSGSKSTLLLLQPVTVTDAVLANSTVLETDHSPWSAPQTYAAGDRVVVGHRIYESAASGNLGNNPAALTGHWFDVGPTNRWAMFDQALGTSTEIDGPLSVTLIAAGANAVALLDVVGTSVRVQAAGYDKTQAVGAGTMTFLDLPVTTGPVTVTVAGTGMRSVGTLLLGKLVGLGVTEASPTAGINDFSRKEFDDFGAPVVVERAWAKRMSAQALIRSEALDLVANRIASVRAKPSLWIGGAGIDSLTIYGFFKDFSVEVGENVSTLSLSIEGLSEAAPLATQPGGGLPPNWTDVIDNEPITRPRPQDGADVTGENTANDTANIGGTPTAQFLQRRAEYEAQVDYLDNVTIPAIDQAFEDADERITAARARADGAHSRIDEIASESGDGDTDTYARSRIAEIQTAFTDADAALAEDITRVETEFGQDLSATAQQITTAYTDAVGAVAEQVTDLRAGGNQNLVIGGGFENGMDDWVGPQFEVRRDGNGTYARATQNGTYELRLKQRFPVFPDTPYTVAAKYGFLASAGVVYVDMRFYDAAGNQIKDGAQNAQPPGRPAFATNGADRDAIAVTDTSPANAASADVRFVVEGATGVQYAAVALIKAEAGTSATAYTGEASFVETSRVLAELDGTVAQHTTRLDVQGASLEQQAGAIQGFGQRTAVYWQVTGTTADGSSRIALTKANGQPGLFLVEANMLLRGDLVVDGTITSRELAQNAATLASSINFSGVGAEVSGAWTNWVGLGLLTVQVEEPGTAVLILATGNLQVSQSATGGGLNGIDGLARVTRSGTVIRDQYRFSVVKTADGNQASGQGPYSAFVLDVPGVGTHTYQVQVIGQPNGGSGIRTGNVLAIDGGLAAIKFKR